GTPAPRSGTAAASRETAGSAGPDITYTNLPTITPERLRRSGYRLVGPPPYNVQIRGARGKPLAKPPVTPAPRTPPPQEDPAVEEARNYAEDFGAQRRRLDQQLADLRAAVGTRNYPVLKANYLAAVAAWDDAFDPVVNDRVPQLWNEVHASRA